MQACTEHDNSMADNALPPVMTAVTRQSGALRAARELAGQLRGQPLALVLFFCSAEYDLEALSTGLQQEFGAVPVVGCTTAGEISTAGYERSSITALGFSSSHFTVASVLVDRMERFGLHDAQEVVEGLVRNCRNHALAPIKGHSFALTLLDGLSNREEVVLAALSAAMGGIPHFGGSAADDNHLSLTSVYYGGQFYSNAAVVVLFNTPLEFEVFTTHHLQPTADKLVVTRVDSSSRRVLELNAEPAAEAYARCVGRRPEELDLYSFASNPLAVRMGKHYYPRSIQQVNSDHSLTFYCAVENGIVLTAMRPGSLQDNLHQLFAGLHERLGETLLTIGCDCFLRRLEAEGRGEQEQVAAILRQYGVTGFNTYGEQFNGMHINQTFTGVAIGQRTFSRT